MNNIEVFKDLHKGHPCYILGNSPSLNKVDFNLLADEITIGCNRIYLMKDFVPLYYTIEDQLVANQIRDDILNYKNSQTSRPLFKFIPVDILLQGDDVVPIQFDRWHPFSFVSKDEGIFYWGWTVTYLMIQLAYYMGCNPIYMVAVDNDYKRLSGGKHDVDIDHFSPDYFRDVACNRPFPHLMEKAYKWAVRHLKSHGIEIYNLSPYSKVRSIPRYESNIYRMDTN